MRPYDKLEVYEKQQSGLAHAALFTYDLFLKDDDDYPTTMSKPADRTPTERHAQAYGRHCVRERSGMHKPTGDIAYVNGAACTSLRATLRT
ncbi:hypothetical protein KDAU_44250 [Dictyobacter aurantiacus]|uniref:Uncharacterized protein n=1 Tax=Dictyobacter aurantiacus TaxID=1936993 RepID=A0A401ZJR5_9CHLR|nr:hypothetical protein KDAU_44250 [Dictyobacter aurantiacus]